MIYNKDAKNTHWGKTKRLQQTMLERLDFNMKKNK